MDSLYYCCNYWTQLDIHSLFQEDLKKSKTKSWFSIQYPSCVIYSKPHTSDFTEIGFLSLNPLFQTFWFHNKWNLWYINLVRFKMTFLQLQQQYRRQLSQQRQRQHLLQPQQSDRLKVPRCSVVTNIACWDVKVPKLLLLLKWFTLKMLKDIAVEVVKGKFLDSFYTIDIEPRQFKNNLTMFDSKLILKLLPFSLTYRMREKRRQFQN